MYVRIQLPEMQEVLRADKGWKETDPRTGEYVFQFCPPSFPGLAIKVYTTISKRDGQSRNADSDAIRVAAVYLPTKRGIVKAARVYRVPGWQARLKDRVIEVIHTALQRKWMVDGTGGNGKRA